MTKRETGIIMDILKGVYPNWMANEQTALLWAELFADDSAEEVSAAVKAYISTDTKGFAPSIGQIKNIMLQFRPQAMNESEAWAMIRKAISNGLYGSVSEFEKLPEVLQRVVGTPSQLREWAMLEEGLDTVVQSHVRRAYRQESEREQFKALLPNDVRNVIEGYSSKLIGG